MDARLDSGMLSAHIFIRMPWPRHVFAQTELAMHRILHPSLFRSLAVVIVATLGVIMSGPAMAHWGDLGDLAGYAQIAGVFFGGVLTALAAGLIATRESGTPAAMPDGGSAQDNEDIDAAADNGCAPDGQQGDQAHA